MRQTGRLQPGWCDGKAAGAVLFTGTLVLSAYLSAAALDRTACSWLACISILPLFWAVRVLGPIGAAVAGATWGAYLCVFLSAAGLADGLCSPSSFALFAMVPAAYAGLGALACRAIGFNPVILGLGWIPVELAFGRLGLQRGLLAAAGGGGLLHVVGRPLGYVFAAVLVACANASLLAALSRVRLRIPLGRASAQVPNQVGWHVLPAPPRIQLAELQPLRPRGPPACGMLLPIRGGISA